MVSNWTCLFPCAGIDPGLSGALAFWNGIEMEVWDTVRWVGCTGKRSYDLDDLWGILDACGISFGVPVFIEAVGHRPGEGSASVKKMGYGEGLWHGLIYGATLDTPRVVQPVVWKRALGLLGQDKEASRALALRLYPELADALRRKKDHGRAEAVLICHYGRWVHAQQKQELS